jgi:cell division septum initiation protein DivIVA
VGIVADRAHRQEILADANSRAELILQEAHEKAAVAADKAARSLPAPPPAWPGERRDMEREIAYLRTYSDVYRRHLRAYLEALLRNVDEWEQSEHRSLPDHPAHPSPPG